MTQTVKSFAWRLVHRPIPIILVLYFVYQLEEMFDWYTTLPAPSIEQSGFAGAALAAFMGLFKFYVDTDGNDKDD